MTTDERLDQVLASLSEIKQVLSLFAANGKEWYTVKEFAALVGNKAEFTVQSWCRNGRIRSEKRSSGRGKYHEWVISHKELLRYQREGLLPPAKG
jgi:hypothetical protein